MSSPLTVVVLAAGKGTRMRTERPKVLHRLAGRTMLGHVLATAARLEPAGAIVVLADGMNEVAAEVERGPLAASIVIQEPQLGTGHALMVARAHLPENGTLLVLYGDTPLITRETLESLLERRQAAGAAVGVLGIRPPDPAGYGRLAFDDIGLAAIIEERHADEVLRREGLCNAGIMAVDGARLGVLLDCLELRRAKNEYYLTDIVHHARARSWPCVALEAPWIEGAGVNAQAQLAECEALMQRRLRAHAMADGVTMVAPETVFLSADTVLAPDVEIGPYVVFGPGVEVERGATILPFCHLERARIRAGAEVGPFARLRPGADIGVKAKVGNFVEIKNTTLEPGAKASHLTYLGDARVGRGTNIGAGTIICNYDGFRKHRTDIGEGVFIGSNTALVAPVTVGDGALVAAGSTITRDLAADELGIARGRQANIPDGARRIRAKQRNEG